MLKTEFDFVCVCVFQVAVICVFIVFQELEAVNCKPVSCDVLLCPFS